MVDSTAIESADAALRERVSELKTAGDHHLRQLLHGGDPKVIVPRLREVLSSLHSGHLMVMDVATKYRLTAESLAAAGLTAAKLRKS